MGQEVQVWMLNQQPEGEVLLLDKSPLRACPAPVTALWVWSTGSTSSVPELLFNPSHSAGLGLLTTQLIF